MALKILSLLLGLALPGFAQDEKKALKLIENNANYKKLAADEQRAALDQIIYEAKLSEKPLTGASVKIHAESLSLADLNAKYPLGKNCDTIGTQEKCTEKETPPRYIWKQNYVELPSFGELFADNEWTYEAGSDEDKAFREALQKVVDTLKAQPGSVIKGVKIWSSASTLRNTGPAEKLTHLKLSQNRGDAAKAVVADFLKSAGYPFDAIEVDAKGENGNGTSGPSSPFKCPKGVDKKFCPEGAGKAPSKKEMIAYFAEQEPDAAATPIQEPPADAEEPAQKATPLEAKPAAPAVAGKAVCEAPPTRGYGELVQLYYYQFKYIKVDFEVSYPVKVEDGKPTVTKDCKARRVDVCVSSYDGGGGGRKPPRKKYRGRRFAACIGCFFYNVGGGVKDLFNKVDCADFRCNDSCGKIFRGR